MEEAVIKRVTLILAILCAIFFISMIGSCSNTLRLKSLRDKEMLTRLDLEERVAKTAQEKQAQAEKLNEFTQQLEKEKQAHQVTKEALSQEQSLSQGLKEEIEKLKELKATLEEDLKEALVKGKKSDR